MLCEVDLIVTVAIDNLQRAILCITQYTTLLYLRIYSVSQV